jgi:hypothetical protein
MTKLLMGKFGKRPPGRNRHTGDDNIKMHLRQEAAGT